MIKIKKNSFKIIPQTVLWFLILFFVLAISKNSYAEGKTTKSFSIEACDDVLLNANKGELNKILIPSEPWNTTKIKVPASLSGSHVVFSKLMDINNDGTLERVFVDSGGTMHWENFYVYGLNTDQEIKLHTSEDDDWESDNLRWAMDQTFIQFKGIYYVLGKTNQSLHYLAYINPKNEMKVVCEFGQRENPIQRLKTSNIKKICELDTIEYNINFDKQHSITDDILQKSGFRETTPSEKAALIDINNDDKKELVIFLDLASGAGPGCGTKYLGVLTPDRSSIDKEFTKKLPQGTCSGGKVIPFIFNGKTYMDIKEEGPHSEHRQIYIFEKDQLKTACEFEVRPDNYVLSPVQKKTVEELAGNTNPWEYAILKLDLKAVKALIQNGRDVNEIIDDSGDRPLHLAVWNKRDDILEVLLKAGANPNVKNEIMSPLQEALLGGNDKAVELLLKYGANINDSDANYYKAASRGAKEKLELLLRYGGVIPDEEVSEIVIGRDKDKYEKLRLLIKYGLDVNKKYTKNVVIEGISEESSGVILVGPEIKTKKVTKTLLEWAQESGDPEAVKILTDAGAKKTDKSLLQKLKEADADLNKSYKLLAASLNEAETKKLKSELQTWIHERDSKCGSFYKGKSIDSWLRNAAANDKRGLCVLEATKKRTTVLSLKFFHEVISPDEKVEGLSQIEWSQKYWEWSRSFPKGHRPSDDISGVYCKENQSGLVWFLAGSSGSSPIIRNCEVPSNKYIFLPVLISLAEAKTQEKDCNRLLTMLDTMLTDVDDMCVEVDGKNIPNFTFWRQRTKCFELKTKEGTSFAASDGYWLMLKPLAPGKHSIKFKGRFLVGNFSQDVQYNITVKELLLF